MPVARWTCLTRNFIEHDSDVILDGIGFNVEINSLSMRNEGI